MPLLAMLFFVHDLTHRGFLSLLLYVHDGTPLRETWRNPFFTIFDHVEGICAALLLVQWTAWGWGTVPFTLLLNESLLLMTRSHFDRLAARRDADYDLLTGLASWRGIENHLRARIAAARRARTSFALLFLDVDGLKRVNDRHGHGAGDTLLTLIGDCCRSRRASPIWSGGVAGTNSCSFWMAWTGRARSRSKSVCNTPSRPLWLSTRSLQGWRGQVSAWRCFRTMRTTKTR